MTAVGSRGPIVIDTNVFSADLVPGARLTDLYEPLVVGRLGFISFQTAAEVRYGALRRGWGEARTRRLEAKLQRTTILQSGPELIQTWAELRVACAEIGHALAQSEHNADRWIAASAVRLGIPLVTDDRIFRGVPGLEVETVAR